MATSKLLEPFKLGPITLPNRFAMAPLTRNRAVAGLVPNALATALGLQTNDQDPLPALI